MKSLALLAVCLCYALGQIAGPNVSWLHTDSRWFLTGDSGFDWGVQWGWLMGFMLCFIQFVGILVKSRSKTQNQCP